MQQLNPIPPSIYRVSCQSAHIFDTSSKKKFVRHQTDTKKKKKKKKKNKNKKNKKNKNKNKKKKKKKKKRESIGNKLDAVRMYLHAYTCWLAKLELIVHLVIRRPVKLQFFLLLSFQSNS